MWWLSSFHELLSEYSGYILLCLRWDYVVLAYPSSGYLDDGNAKVCYDGISLTTKIDANAVTNALTNNTFNLYLKHCIFNKVVKVWDYNHKQTTPSQATT